MENWEKELQQHNLQKAVNAEFGYNMPIEDMLEKAAPIGTRKTWQGGREFVKTAEGWKPVPKKDRQMKPEEGKTQPEPEKKSDGVVITNPDKFKVESEDKPQSLRGKPTGKVFKVNGVKVCETTIGGDYFNSPDSRVRDRFKTTYETKWDSEGLKKVTGRTDITFYGKNPDFKGLYPDLRWGDQGGLMNQKEVKEKISTFLKESKNPDGSLRKTSYSWVTDDDRNQIKEVLGQRTITDDDQNAVAKILGLDPKDPKFDMSWTGNNTGLYPTKTIVIKYGGETLAHSRTYPA